MGGGGGKGDYAPETEDCECKTYSVEVKGRKVGCGVPLSMAHGLANIAELFSDLFSRLVAKFIQFLMQKTIIFFLFCNERSLVYVSRIIIHFLKLNECVLIL